MVAAAKQPKQNKNVFLFYGEDSYSSYENLKRWEKEFIKKYGDTNIEILDGKTLDPSEFETNIGTMPFLSEKRLVIIKNFFKKEKKKKTEAEAQKKEADSEIQKRIAKSLDKDQEFSIIVFYETETPDKRTSLYKKILEIGEIKEFPALTENAVTKWILEKAAQKEIKISYQNSSYLGTQCGLDLWTISNELSKLETFSDKKEITKDMIDSLVTPSLSASIFKLTDAIANKSLREALKTFKTLIDSEEEATMIFFMIVRHFRILIQVFDLLSKKEPPFSITKKLKQHPFVIQNMSKQAKNFTLESLESIYQKLLKIDKNFKTGVIKSFQGDTNELELAIEKLIIECCK